MQRREWYFIYLGQWCILGNVCRMARGMAKSGSEASIFECLAAVLNFKIPRIMLQYPVATFSNNVFTLSRPQITRWREIILRTLVCGRLDGSLMWSFHQSNSHVTCQADLPLTCIWLGGGGGSTYRCSLPETALFQTFQSFKTPLFKETITKDPSFQD